jgi:hypothetical protein
MHDIRLRPSLARPGLGRLGFAQREMEGPQTQFKLRHDPFSCFRPIDFPTRPSARGTRRHRRWLASVAMPSIAGRLATSGSPSHVLLSGRLLVGQYPRSLGTRPAGRRSRNTRLCGERDSRDQGGLRPDAGGRYRNVSKWSSIGRIRNCCLSGIRECLFRLAQHPLIQFLGNT